MESGADNGGRASGLIPVARGEVGATVLAGLFFFFVLFAVMMLRPVREAMGVEGGMSELRGLFVLTALVSLVVAILFGGLVSRLDRRRFLPIGFRVVMLCLVGFAVARGVMGDEIKQHAGRVFYVWFSVFNMFVTSIFWAYMADIWRLDQAKRLYPVIGVGGTLGALAGASVPWTLGEWLDGVGPAWMSGPVWLMLLSIVLFELAVRVMLVLDRRMSEGTSQRPKRTPHAVGGTLIDGLVAVSRSPYLLLIAMYVGLVAVSSTIVYFTGVELVVDKEEELAGRLSLFAQLDVWKQIATLCLQLFVTSRLIKLIGVGGTLCVLPVLTVGGFAAVWLAGNGSDALVWGTFAIFQGFHSASRYAFVRPARETLFSVLSESEKYKAKTVVDMFVYRAGDVAGVGTEAGLKALGVASVGAVTVATMPMAACWVALALGLGVLQKRRAGSSVEG